MTPIDPLRLGPSGAGRLRAVAAPGMQQAAGAFQVAAESESGTADAASQVADTTPVSLGVMLAAEALDRDAVHDRAARRHGLVVLGGLTALQRALLEGGDTAVSLERLAALLADMPHAVEPRLAALLDTIVLRVRVELARLDGSGGQAG
jgi:hypothetical protein